MVNCVQGLKSTYNNSKDIYETEINKLKEVIEALEHSLQAEQVQKKLQINRLNENIKSLEDEIRHINHLNQMEIKELKQTFESELAYERRNLQREKEVEITNYNVIVKRLKN